jgi:hypothetical protein
VTGHALYFKLRVVYAGKVKFVQIPGLSGVPYAAHTIDRM